MSPFFKLAQGQGRAGAQGTLGFPGPAGHEAVKKRTGGDLIGENAANDPLNDPVRRFGGMVETYVLFLYSCHPTSVLSVSACARS